MKRISRGSRLAIIPSIEISRTGLQPVEVPTKIGLNVRQGGLHYFTFLKSRVIKYKAMTFLAMLMILLCSCNPQNNAQLTTPTSTSTESFLNFPSITAKTDTNCRLGPSTHYNVVGWLVVGNISKVHGRLQSGGWWYIENVSNNEPKFCWVWAETTIVTGDTDMLPFITPLALQESIPGQETNPNQGTNPMSSNLPPLVMITPGWKSGANNCGGCIQSLLQPLNIIKSNFPIDQNSNQ